MPFQKGNKIATSYPHPLQCGFQKGHPQFTDKRKLHRFTEAETEKAHVACRGKDPWNKGKKYPEFSGKNHPNWIADRTKLAKQQERGDMSYREWRRLVKKRDGNVCQMRDENCRGYMIAAHIKSWALYPELRYEVSNGITLCQGHHPKTRNEDKRLMPVFQELVGSSI